MIVMRFKLLLFMGFVAYNVFAFEILVSDVRELE